MRGEMQVQVFNFFYITLVRSVVLHLQSLWIIRFNSGVSLLSDGTIVVILVAQESPYSSQILTKLRICRRHALHIFTLEFLHSRQVESTREYFI
jgi:hypothetical protein